MKKEERILKIMCWFLLLQPFFDILSFLRIREFLPFPISTWLKPLIVFGLTFYLIVTNKSVMKKWFIYLFLYGIYCFIHFLILYRLTISLAIIFHEMRFLINIAYMMCIFIIMWYLYYAYKDKKIIFHKIKNALITSIMIYAFIIIIAIISNTSSLTYEYADSSKVGYKGWFDSGQILGHAMSICLPFIIVSILSITNLNFIKKIIVIFLPIICMLLFGTKVPYLMVSLVAFSLMLAFLLIKIFNKSIKISITNSFLLLIIFIIPVVFYNYSPVKQNIDINEVALQKPIEDYTEEEDITGSHGLVFFDNIKDNNTNIKNYYEWNKEATEYLAELYSNGDLHPANSRGKQYEYNKKLFELSSLEYKLFGIGYLNQSSGLSLESDILMSYFCFGIFGALLMLCMIFIEIFKATIYILTNLNKVDLETYSLYIGIAAFIGISVYAGYTFIYTNFSIFLVVLLFLLKIKIRTIAGNKVMFISSTGGHFSELMQLKQLFKKYDYYIVTEKTKTNTELKEQHNNKIAYLVYGTKDHMLLYPFKFIYNCFKSLYLYLKIRPKVIVTTGTHTAVPMCYIAKLFGTKVVFIETFANMETKTLSGKLVYPIADVFIVQWKSMLKLYPKARYGGWIY